MENQRTAKIRGSREIHDTHGRRMLEVVDGASNWSNEEALQTGRLYLMESYLVARFNTRERHFKFI